MVREAAEGLLAVDKPAGITSHGVTERLRPAFGTRRIGHAGTLDPFATGLLLVLVGRATRLLPYLDIQPKVYLATIRFGARTSTDDAEGEVVQVAPPPPQQVVEQVLPSLTGNLLQRPPVFSAKQLGGVRAHAAARRGDALELRPASVVVHEWKVLRREGADLDVQITCGGGTYIRALGRDLGEATGSAAHVASLRRTRSGRHRVEDAISLADAQAGAPLVTPASVVSHLPSQALDDLDARRVTHGQRIIARAAGDVAALMHDGALVAIGGRDGDEWKPRVVLRDVD